jgi:IclR family transcriptional regulator, acetate operon repressor
MASPSAAHPVGPGPAVAAPADVARGGSTRAVERALALLAEICEHDVTTLTEAARRTHLAPSTALRLLRTLEHTGFVTRNADASWTPGARAIALGATVVGRASLVRLAGPALRRIVEATGETAYLVVADADRAVYVGMVEGSRSVRHTSWVGRTIDARGLAVGRALAGEVPPAGFVAERDLIEPDVTAVAAPVRRPGGIVGALNLLGPTYRIDDATMREYGRIVAREAAALGRAFGVVAEVPSLPTSPSTHAKSGDR